MDYHGAILLNRFPVPTPSLKIDFSPPAYTTHNEDETVWLGENLAAQLMPGDAVFLYGDLGAGKTHFVKGLAQGLGVSETIKSPTYTFVRSYDLESDLATFHHYDLYRLEDGDDTASIGYAETIEDPDAIHAVEWADRLEDDLPDKRVEVYLEPSADDSRLITIRYFDPEIVPAEAIGSFFEEFSTPLHVRRHCLAVGTVTLGLARAMMRHFRLVNTDLLWSAALLHDFMRVVDFSSLDRSSFEESISEKTWQKWVDLRQQYAGRDHADVAGAILRERGFDATATMIEAHLTHLLLERPERLNTLEKKLLYYSDKRVQHDTIVSIVERFTDGRRRWFNGMTPEQEEAFSRTEKAALELEKVLFEGLEIGPEDID